MSGMLGAAGDRLRGWEPGRALTAIRQMRRELEYAEEAQVANALYHGWSWARIGRALGITRQAAHHKYSRCVPARVKAPSPSLTPPVRVAVMLARTEAAARGDALVGTEHLLIGLLQQGDGPAADALRDAGVSLRVLRSALDVLAPCDVCRLPAAQIGLTSRASHAIESAALRAHSSGEMQISDIHMLSALLERSDSGAVYTLQAVGADMETVIRALGASLRSCTTTRQRSAFAA